MPSRDDDRKRQLWQWHQNILAQERVKAQEEQAVSNTQDKESEQSRGAGDARSRSDRGEEATIPPASQPKAANDQEEANPNTPQPPAAKPERATETETKQSAADRLRELSGRTSSDGKEAASQSASAAEAESNEKKSMEELLNDKRGLGKSTFGQSLNDKVRSDQENDEKNERKQ